MLRWTSRRVELGLLYFSAAFLIASPGTAQDFRSAWPEDVERTWVGPQYWANRLQDWRVAGGRLECVEARPGKPMRTVHLLTRRLGRNSGDLRMSVRTGVIGKGETLSAQTWTGFLLGAGGEELDYRAAALVHHAPGRGGGLIVALNGRGEIVFRDNGAGAKGDPYPLLPAKASEGEGFERKAGEDIELGLEARFISQGYSITLAAHDHASGRLLAGATLEPIPPARLIGNIALVSHHGPAKGGARYWFRDWRVAGRKAEVHEERAFGPVLCTQHTLSNGILKMTAQMPPLGEKDSRTARLEVRYNGIAPWITVSTGTLIVPGYTIPFRVEGWDSRRDAEYRVVYPLRESGGTTREYFWHGRIRREPLEKETVVVAAFTGNNNVGIAADGGAGDPGASVRWTIDNVWFPHSDIVRHVAAHNPDVLVFTGDQVYEGRSPTRPEREPLETACLDYLYKWYLWCWAFRDLARDRVCVCMPDDHDVYQGNLWGWGGRAAPGGDHNKGGYVMPAEFVRMVERTQTSHLPDPYDPTPVQQNIGVYYCAMNYAGIGFAVLEDRKFKTPATVIGGLTSPGTPVRNVNFDAILADVPEARLLGERQLAFLRHWAADWYGVTMKVALSQTIFCCLQTRDRYPDGLARDFDSNGWPQTGRNCALHELRRGFAFMVGGDQHLASVVHHGIADWNDAGWSFCVPSIANFFLRFWEPPLRGRHHLPGLPDYTGEYLDGLGNPITVRAVANPRRTETLTEAERAQRAVELHRKAPGYGIVRLNKTRRTITMEAWPRNVDPAAPGARPYPGWPVTIRAEDNYGRQAAAYLPTLEFRDFTDPVVQVIDERRISGSASELSRGQVLKPTTWDSADPIVYTLRAHGNTFRPKVFDKDATYTVIVSEPGTLNVKTFEKVKPVRRLGRKTIKVRF